MSYLNNMYGAARGVPANNNKNPNRVAGGLRGQGYDHFTMLGEDGTERQIPTHKYVQALEEKLRVQDARIQMLEKKMKGLSNEQRDIVTNQRVVINAIERKNNN
jgi:hypothetical protein